MRRLISVYSSRGIMHPGILVKGELLVVLTGAAEFEVLDVLKIVVGMKAPDARKAVRIWKVTSFRIVFDP